MLPLGIFRPSMLTGHMFRSMRSRSLRVLSHSMNIAEACLVQEKSSVVDGGRSTECRRSDEEERRVELSLKDHKKQLRGKSFPQLNNTEILKVVLLGAPNAGKSTLTNRLIGWKVAAVSQKVHTTRHNIIGSLTEENKQVVFLDTPGIIVPTKLKRHKLERSLLTEPHSAVSDADLIAVVVDVSHVWHRARIDPEILKVLHLNHNKQSVLVLNKVDLLRKKDELLHIARTLTEGVVAGVQSWATGRQRRLAAVSLRDIFSRTKAATAGTGLELVSSADREMREKLRDENELDILSSTEAMNEDESCKEISDGGVGSSEPSVGLTRGEYSSFSNNEGRLANSLNIEKTNDIDDCNSAESDYSASGDVAIELQTSGINNDENRMKARRDGDRLEGSRTPHTLMRCGEIIRSIETGDDGTTIDICESSQQLLDISDVEENLQRPAKSNSLNDSVLSNDNGVARDLSSHDPSISEGRNADLGASSLNLKEPAAWNAYYKRLGEIGRSIRDRNGWLHFSRVFMISALSGDGVMDLRDHLLKSTQPGRWVFSPSVVTDQDPVELARLCVWERLLDNLPDEVPYNVNVRLSLWEVSEDDLLRASFDIVCYQKRHLYYVLGPEGKTIRRIAAEAKQELMNTFRRELSLRLIVRGGRPGVADPNKNDYH